MSLNKEFMLWAEPTSFDPNRESGEQAASGRMGDNPILVDEPAPSYRHLMRSMFVQAPPDLVHNWAATDREVGRGGGADKT